MTTLKRIVLWGWVKAQSRSQLCSNVVAARAEANEAQFMADIENRAADMGKTKEELIQEIFKAAGLDFASGRIELEDDTDD